MLMIAAENGNEQLVDLFLKAGANVEDENEVSFGCYRSFCE